VITNMVRALVEQFRLSQSQHSKANTSWMGGGHGGHMSPSGYHNTMPSPDQHGMNNSAMARQQALMLLQMEQMSSSENASGNYMQQYQPYHQPTYHQSSYAGYQQAQPYQPSNMNKYNSTTFYNSSRERK